MSGTACGMVMAWFSGMSATAAPADWLLFDDARHRQRALLGLLLSGMFLVAGIFAAAVRP